MPKKITVLTSYMHQRGGDLVSAVSFMKAILQHDPTVEFEWIVKRDISGFRKGKEELAAFVASELGAVASNVAVTCLDSADYKNVIIDKAAGTVQSNQSKKFLSTQELTDLSEENWGNLQKGAWKGWKDVHEHLTSKKLGKPDLMVISATPHRLVRQDYKRLQAVQPRILSIPEYDLNHTQVTTYGAKEHTIIHTGFGAKCSSSAYNHAAPAAGVYIDDTVTSSHGLDDIAEQDHAFSEHLTGGNLAYYNETNTLFYGYFFDEVAHVTGPVTATAFITNSIMLAMDNMTSKKTIDIVIPGYKDPGQLRDQYQEAIKQLPDEYKNKLQSVQYDLKQGEQFNTEVIGTGEGSFNIRLINPGRLERKTVQALLNDSEPWVGLTGDASWIEGLMKGKLVCYQVVRWKAHFFSGFINYITEKLGANSPLCLFYKAQKVGDFSGMRALYASHLPAMQQQAKELALLIKKEKNLSNNIVTILMDLGVLSKNPAAPSPPAKVIIQSLGEFKDKIRGHLSNTPQYGWFYFATAHEPAKLALTVILDSESSTQGDVCEALITYYKSVSRFEWFAIGQTSNRHQKQFEQFMKSIGVINSDQEISQIENNLGWFKTHAYEVFGHEETKDNKS